MLGVYSSIKYANLDSIVNREAFFRIHWQKLAQQSWKITDIRRVFVIFATIASFLRIIANLQIQVIFWEKGAPALMS